MSAFYIRYPSSTSVSTNPANGTNGVTAPSISTQVGGVDGSGNLQPIHLDSAGNLKVNVVAEASGITYLTSGRLDYSITNVDDTTWTQVIADTGVKKSQQITIFDGGGFAMELGVGGVGSEVRTMLIPPGGLNGPIPLILNPASRLSVRAVGAASVTAGEIDLNILG